MRKATSQKEVPQILVPEKTGNEAGFYLTGQVVAEDTRRERFQTVPYKGVWGLPRTGFCEAQLASACLRVVPPCGTEAGAFLSSLKKDLLSDLLELGCEKEDLHERC